MRCRRFAAFLLVLLLSLIGCGGVPAPKAPPITSSSPIASPTTVTSDRNFSASTGALAPQAMVLVRPSRPTRPIPTQSATYPAIEGNWDFTSVSSIYGQEAWIEGYISASGPAISGNVFVLNSQCFSSTPLSVSGTLTPSGTLTFKTAAHMGQVIEGTLTVSGTHASGTWTITGTGCAAGDHGPVTGYIVPNISGFWSGSVRAFDNTTHAVMGNITQSTLPGANGWYALTGNLNFADSVCFSSGTIFNGRMAGSFGWLDVNVGSATIVSVNALVYDETAKRIDITYTVNGGICSGDQGYGAVYR